MLRQLLVGGIASVANVAIHALMMTIVMQVARKISFRKAEYPALRLSLVMMAVVSVLMATHTGEVALWALVYWLTEAVPQNRDQFYFAFVNYTTLGYGDLTPVKDWQLLGPMTAMSGVLMFGWSTAVIFEVLRRATLDFRG